MTRNTGELKIVSSILGQFKVSNIKKEFVTGAKAEDFSSKKTQHNFNNKIL